MFNFFKTLRAKRLNKKHRKVRDEILKPAHNTWLVTLMIGAINQGAVDKAVIQRYKSIQYQNRRSRNPAKGGRRSIRSKTITK